MKDQSPSPGHAGQGAIITERLYQRRVRPIQSSFMNSVIVDLEMRNAVDPVPALQRVARAVIELTGAHSAGVSVLEQSAAGEVFAWRAVAGQWAAHAGLVLPRQASPCGLALERAGPLLLAQPGQHYPALRQLQPVVVEGMYSAFADAGTPGVIWALAQDAELEFDGQDAFMLQELGLRAAASFGANVSAIPG